MPHRRTNQRTTLLAVLVLAAVALVFWGNCLVGGRVPVAAVYQKQMLPWAAVTEATGETRQWDSLLWDSMAQFYPWRLLLHRAGQSGQLPLWNPYQFCGYPFVGNGQSAMFYPPNWLYFLVHPKVGLGLSAALHFLLGGLFVFGLARAWRLSVLPALFAALAFSYGGFMVTWIELPTLPNSLIWLPLAWWGIELVCRQEGPASSRPAVHGMAMIALALGMTLLAGHFQIAAYVWIFAIIYGLVRLIGSRPGRVLSRLAMGAVLGLALGLVQVLPTLELGQLSARGSGGPTAEGFQFHHQRALQPLELLTLFDPNFFGSPVTNDYAGISYSEHCGFVGAITVLLGLAGLVLKPRRKLAWLFGGIALFALWGAMGGPPAMLLYWGVPKLGQAGGFSRLLSVWTLAAAVWGGVGLQAVMESLRGLRKSPEAAVDRGLKPPAEEPAADRPADGDGYGDDGLLSASAGRSAQPSCAPQPGASAPGKGAPPSPDSVRRTLGGAAAPDVASPDRQGPRTQDEEAAVDRGLKPPAEEPAADRPADGDGHGYGYGGAAGGRAIGTGVALVALALLLLQVLPWAYRFNPRARAEEVYPETELIRQLRARLGNGRYVAANDRDDWTLMQVPAGVVMPPNAATVYELRSVDGYDSLFPLRYRQFAAQVEGADPSPLANGNMLLTTAQPSYAADVAVTPAAAAPLYGNFWRRAWSGEGCELYGFMGSKPRAGIDRAYQRGRTLHWLPQFPRIAERLNEITLSFAPPGSRARLTVYDASYPGWQAFAGGVQLAIDADVYRSVPLEGSETQVRMVFFPASVTCGMFVSLVGLMVMAAMAVCGKAGRGQ